jgi:hypothetical protein
MAAPGAKQRGLSARANGLLYAFSSKYGRFVAFHRKKNVLAKTFSYRSILLIDKMDKTQNKLAYILFPGITILLGWGLRGFIGGGPFGAMIPGAMIGIALCLLLGVSARYAALVTVFAVLGVGIGGEMTYGQTIHFLREIDTLAFATVGTTVKGAVWGLCSGLLIAVGFLHVRIGKRAVVIGMLLFFVGMLLGFKLINDPKLIYFSDPVNKPRAESWAALLVGALLFLVWLKTKLSATDFKVVLSFVLWGTLGGGLGFGLGGLWIFTGVQLKEIDFISWWKMMEFTFGLLLGGALGWATWINRDYLQAVDQDTDRDNTSSLLSDLVVATVLSFAIFWLLPFLLEPLLDSTGYDQGFLSGVGHDLLRILTNYAFLGFLMLLVGYKAPGFAWQVATTLTFCHTAIDLMEDMNGETGILISQYSQIVCIVVSSLLVAFLTSKFAKTGNTLKQMMLLLIWSTMLVATLKVATQLSWAITNDKAISYIVTKVFSVYLVFLISAIYSTWFTIRKIE